MLYYGNVPNLDLFTMSNQAINTTEETEVVCNHKPGDVWADGCCTSKRNQKTKDTLEAEALETENAVEQLVTANQN